MLVSNKNFFKIRLFVSVGGGGFEWPNVVPNPINFLDSAAKIVCCLLGIGFINTLNAGPADLLGYFPIEFHLLWMKDEMSNSS